MVKRIYYIFIVFLLTAEIFSQEQEKIEQKKDELSGIKSQIENLEIELNLKTEKEKESFEVLENYNEQSHLLRKLITKLKAEEQLKQKEIDRSIIREKQIEKEIKILRKNYSKYIVAIYKYGSTNELASLFDAGSINQALSRYKYLSKFSEKREEDLNNYKNRIEELKIVQAGLEKERLEKKNLARQKQKEENGLEAKQKERKKILNAIKDDKAALNKELEAKKNAEIKIKQMINKLIVDAERRRKEEEERLANSNEDRAIPERDLAELDNTSLELTREYDIDLSTSGFSSFSNLKGKLIWPVTNGKIIRNFGENIHDNLNTVTLNYGVDIEAGSDLNVRAVAEGVVSAIDWIPGYGSVIIITHKGDYRTVYSHISDLYVAEGDRIKAGNIIARVGESLEGNILHFEIWNSRTNQNPEVWLVRK